MATAKKTPAVPASKKAAAAAKTAKAAALAKTPVAKKAVATKAVAQTTAALKPIKTAFNKSGLATHLAELSGVEPKATKAVLAALESTMLASIHRKGLGEFTLPGLLKVTALSVPAKKKRLGKDPFTGEERMFAAKPATTRIKTRALKKLKDAAL